MIRGRGSAANRKVTRPSGEKNNSEQKEHESNVLARVAALAAFSAPVGIAETDHGSLSQGDAWKHRTTTRLPAKVSISTPLLPYGILEKKRSGRQWELINLVCSCVFHKICRICSCQILMVDFALFFHFSVCA